SATINGRLQHSRVSSQIAGNNRQAPNRNAKRQQCCHCFDSSRTTNWQRGLSRRDADANANVQNAGSSSKEQPGSLTASNAFPKNGFANSVPTSNGGSFTHMKFPTVQQQRAAASVTAGGYRGSLASVPAGALRFQQPQAQAANTAPGVGISPGSGLSVRRRPSQPHAAVQATADSSSVGVSPVLRTAVQPHPLRDPLHQQHQAAHQLDVTPQPHPFFDHLEVVMPPTALVPSRINNRQQTAELTFSLSRQQAETVALNRYRLPGVGRQRTDYGVQVLLRCFKIGPGELPDCFPPGVSLAVNANQDQQAATALAGYCVTVSLARALTAQQLTQRVLELSPIPASGTRTKIVDMLGGSGGGDEVALTDLTASLRCPLTRSRIGIPARGRDCAHLQCFDASVFLTMNERKSSWRCPCCDRPLRLDDLRVDELFRDILAARAAADPVDTVRFLPDGGWVPAEAEQPGAAAATVESSNGDGGKVVVAFDLTEDGPAAPAAPAPPAAPAAPATQPTAPATPAAPT
uniref:SP-RING-type domain-containing protein n=1 Tax=Macrostomum lignano TaxID=282301 RepID=A0A1I8GKK6_9PLAT